MEERRLLLAVALSLLVLTAYQFLFPSPRPSPRPSTPGAGAAADPAPSPSVAAATPPGAAAPVAPTAAPARPAVADERERRVEVVGADFTVAFTNRGARMLSWQLALFKDRRGRPEEMVLMLPAGPRPLDIETGDEAMDRRLAEALFRPSTENLVLDPGRAGELRFEFADGEVEVVKRLRFPEGGGLVEIRASVRRGGQELPVRVIWGPGVGNPTPEEMEVQGYHPPQAVYRAGGAVERIPPAELAQGRSVSAEWGGLESTHFAALLVPPAGVPVVFRTVPTQRPGQEAGPPAPVAAVALAGPEVAALLYVGPKDHARLSRVGHRLAEVVPVGEWIGPIVIPLMGALKWAHEKVGNYGWAIVVLTVIINVLMAPLRHYSIANGVKMAKLAPEMRVIQDRYRKVPALDPRRQEMQKEIGALYARHGMNMGTQMAVGCVPILITMPFLIAFYRVLSVAVELRGAPFLWIPDLSQKDPLYITPVLMAASMFLMQKMMPTTMDPAQARMMMIMPLVLGVMFFAAPAGLNLYWLASNVCSIIQQGVTLRLVQDPVDRRRE